MFAKLALNEGGCSCRGCFADEWSDRTGHCSYFARDPCKPEIKDSERPGCVSVALYMPREYAA
jgi:hypothetical protein